MEFELSIVPPTVTAQEHKVRIVHRKPLFYDTPRLKEARQTFETLLKQHRPSKPLEGALLLDVEWRFRSTSHKENAYRVTRPDTDNLQKLLKDCMTRVGFWKDDAQVCREHVTKRWSKAKPGISIRVVTIDDE